MSDTQRQDEADRQRRRERQIRDENRRARQRAADPARRDQIDPSTGRTWRDAVDRGMYGPSRIQNYRDLNARNRETNAWLQRAARAAGNQGHVRDTLAAREPRTSAAVERAVRDLSPPTRGRTR